MKNLRKNTWLGKKCRNVLDCSLRRRQNAIATLKTALNTFKKDTKEGEEHSSFALQKLEGMPHKLLKNEIRNSERHA